jgi:hypothetical protein
LRRALVVTIVTVVLVPALAVAQYNTAEISGTVRDEQGGVLPDINDFVVQAARAFEDT